MFVIRRTDQGGGFVAPSRNEHSFVRRVEDARHFSTRDEAERHCCPGNEVITRCPHCAGNGPSFGALCDFRLEV